MKTSIKTKKGFTVVELVIVIAVIAILAAVLIPTFVNLVNKANVSADVQLVRNLNTALALDKTENGKHDTMHDAVHALDDYGFDVTKLYKTISEGNTLLWDSVNDVFCLYDGKNVGYYPEVETETSAEDKYKFFAIYDNVPEEQNFSIYYTGDKTDANVLVGFDAGHTQSNVTYSGEKTDVIVRMFGGELTVSNGKVTVYGFVGAVEGKDKITAGKGVVFHKDISADGIESSENGSFGDNHLFGEDGNELFCLVEKCGEPNGNHVCVYNGKYTVSDIDGKEGYKLVTLLCDICDKPMGTIKIQGEVVETPVEGCEHEWTDKGEINATCTTPGMKVQVCTKCSGINSYQVQPALGHDWQEHEGKDATCGEDGYTAYKTCKRKGCQYCTDETNKGFGYEVIEATGKHAWQETSRTDATCEAVGKVESKCSVCQQTMSETLDLVDHTWQEIAEVPATCTTAGYTAYKKCSVCERTEGGKIIEAHHTMTVSVQARPATCLEAGYTAHTKCANCDHTEGKDSIDRLVHKYEYVLKGDGCVHEACNNGCGHDIKLVQKDGNDNVFTLTVKLNNYITQSNEAHSTMHSVFEDVVAKGGYSGIPAVIEAIKDAELQDTLAECEYGFKILWDQRIDKFVVVTMARQENKGGQVKVQYTPGEDGGTLYATHKAYVFWDTFDDANDDELFGYDCATRQDTSIYWANTKLPGIFTNTVDYYSLGLRVGFDIGLAKETVIKNNIKLSIDDGEKRIYNIDNAQTTISVGGHGTVVHYGKVTKIDVACTEALNYYEYGCITDKVVADDFNVQYGGVVPNKFKFYAEKGSSLSDAVIGTIKQLIGANNFIDNRN